MSDHRSTEPPSVRAREHTSRHWGQWTSRFIIFGMIGVMFGMGNLYRVQNNYENCVAEYLDTSSQAQRQRGDANRAVLNSLVDGFVSIQGLTDPDHQPPSEETVKLFYKAVAEVPRTAERYNVAAEEHPLPNFRATCGG